METCENLGLPNLLHWHRRGSDLPRTAPADKLGLMDDERGLVDNQSNPEVSDDSDSEEDTVVTQILDLSELVRRKRRLFFACVAMVVLGVCVGMCSEGWDFLTALYFITQIVTTVGYGDVTVRGEHMRIFMGIYILLSLLIVANLLNIITSFVIERHAKVLRKRLRWLELGVDASDQKASSKLQAGLMATVFMASSIGIGMIFFRFMESCTCPTFDSGCVGQSYDLCVATGGQELTWPSAFYMAVVTVTTVGFGDYTPKSDEGRLFACFWMVCGVAGTGYFITAMSECLAGGEPGNQFEDADDIHEALFRKMDKDGNGYLTKREYATYVLVKHGLLTQDILDDIERKYDEMDCSGSGQLTWQAVQEAAQRMRLRARAASSM